MAKKWFHFHQSNSGGVMKGPIDVYVRAKSAAKANEKAQEYADVYFDGCRIGVDCLCCGDRWTRADDYDAEDTLPRVHTRPDDDDYTKNSTIIPLPFDPDGPKVQDTVVGIYIGYKHLIRVVL